MQIAVAMGTAIAALAGTVWLGGAPSDTSHTGEAGGAARVAGLADSAGASVTQRRQSAVPAPGEQPLPLSLSGSMAPRLPLDARGRLAQTRAVRDFFDYFLAAQHEMSAAALDTMVQREIASQLDGTAAQAEALDLWRRYSAYRDAVTRTAPLQAPQQVNGASSGPDLDAIQSALAQRASIAGRTMGTAWSESFFGHEWRRANCDLARLRVTNDGSLTDAQKAARLEALTDLLPPDERAASEREARLRASVEAIAALQTQSLPAEELRAAATQALGAEAAERVVQMQKDDFAWREKYEAYADQRARIDAMGLAPADRDAQIAQLRERAFATDGERLRAASLDTRPGD
ncbi:MAG TPA: lipase secretion chaperone [Trinickia sp.]|nr:lipase secretion chaperone [Trinickia sp.]